MSDSANQKIAISNESPIWHIAGMLYATKVEKTPLIKQLDQLTPIIAPALRLRSGH